VCRIESNVIWTIAEKPADLENVADAPYDPMNDSLESESPHEMTVEQVKLLTARVESHVHSNCVLFTLKSRI